MNRTFIKRYAASDTPAVTKSTGKMTIIAQFSLFMKMALKHLKFRQDGVDQSWRLTSKCSGALHAPENSYFGFEHSREAATLLSTNDVTAGATSPQPEISLANVVTAETSAAMLYHTDHGRWRMRCCFDHVVLLSLYINLSKRGQP